MPEENNDMQVGCGNSDTASYRSIFKATSLFGGVQVYQILIGVIRSKVIAVLLGPMGMGVLQLFNSSTELIKQVSSLGLSQSAVRDVSAAVSEGDSYRIGRTVAVVKKLVWYTGLLGMFLVLLISPLLSKSSFGSYDYTVSFIFLSVILLFDQLAAGQRVILQGTRKLKYLAKSSALGLTLGLVISIPFYYFGGVAGIVPTLIISSIAALIISTYYSRKVPYEKVRMPIKEVFREGKVMICMGIALNLSTLLASLSSYIFRSFLSVTSGTEMVGYYAVGVTITTSYVGMIFSAMNADFYPRLVAAIQNKDESNKIISHQGEIGSLVLGPAIIGCLLFMPLIIWLLYSSEFIVTSNYVAFAIVGMMLRLVGWLSSILFVAHGDAKLFAINEAAANLYFLFLNIIGFKVGGLTGVGISFIVSYMLYFVHIFSLARRKYELSFSSSFVKEYLIQISLIILGLLIVLVFDLWLRYLIGAILMFGVCSYSLIELNKRIRVVDYLRNN